MTRKSSNPLAGPQKPARLKVTLPKLADLWMKAAEKQAERVGSASATETLIEMELFVVCAQRLREVARMAAEKLTLPAVRTALDNFDSCWPHLKNLRDLQEHMLVPRANFSRGDLGLTFFGDLIADLRPGGAAVYIVRPADTIRDLEELHRRVIAGIAEVT